MNSGSLRMMFLRLLTVVACRIGMISTSTEPNEYILSFPREDNALNISVVTPLSKNYIITLGDWGAASTAQDAIAVQKVVAEKLKSFYESRKSLGYNLLFIAVVGDNFYWTGQNCENEFDQHWSEIYGSNLTQNDGIKWLGVYGNHDWGNSDPYALCAWNNTKYTNKTTGIPYAANQLNKDKGGCNPSSYWIPDFSYYYTISNLLNFELIGLETTYYFCPQELGGGHGNNLVFKNCETAKRDDDKKNGIDIGCNYLQKINNASEELLLSRAKYSKNKNFLLMQHYPEESERLLNFFIANRDPDNISKAWSIFGHAHDQKCKAYDSETGECAHIETGGGGGCCGLEFTTRGFYVIGFDDDGIMTQPYQFNDSAISCQYPCGVDINKGEAMKQCCYTTDSSFCQNDDVLSDRYIC